VAIDTLFAGLTDPDGLLVEAQEARSLGYSGKLIIHPDQIELVHRTFAPSPTEVAHVVAHAREVLKLAGSTPPSLPGP
jgi:citrate lyase beta subunit